MALNYPSIIRPNFINMFVFYYEHLVPFFTVLYFKVKYFQNSSCLNLVKH